MANELEAPARVRLLFSNRHLLSKEQRSKGLRRCWAVILPEITTVGEFSHHIRSRFGLRCGSADDLFLSMDGSVLPSFESTSMFRDKDLIRVQTSICKKKKKKIVITDGSPANENERVEVLSIDNGENSNHQKKRASPEETTSKKIQKDSEKSESAKKKLKLTPHERPVAINTSNNNRFSVTIASHNDGTSGDPTNPVVVASDKSKQVTVNCQTRTHGDGANEKNELGSALGNGVLGPPPSYLMPGQTNLLSPVKESQLEIAPKENYSKSVKVKNKGKRENWKNADGNVDNWEAGTGNDLGNSTYPSGGNNKRNSGWEATEASNGNGAAQTQENGWETWLPSTSRAGASRSSMGQNSNFGSRAGFSRGKNGRGRKYSSPKFGK